MARWTFAGAVGAVAGPLLLAGFVLRRPRLARALRRASPSVALVLVVRARRVPDDGRRRGAARASGRRCARSRRREVFRWLFLLELSDLLGDVFLGFLALYLVDEAGDLGRDRRPRGRRLDRRRARRRRRDDPAARAGRRPALPARERGAPRRRSSSPSCSSRRSRRSSSSSPRSRSSSAGWYSVLQARLYGALGGGSGLVLTVGALFPLNAVAAARESPLLAERWGLGRRALAAARRAARAPCAGPTRPRNMR